MGARSGNNRIMWRTGQKMIEDHVPKIGGGFRPKRKFKVLTLGKLQQMIENGRLKVPEDRPLNVKDIFDARILTLRQVRAHPRARCIPYPPLISSVRPPFSHARQGLPFFRIPQPPFCRNTRA